MNAIPELKHGEGSWVCTNGPHCVELFSRKNVQLLADRGWKVKTIGAHLASLNQKASTAQNKVEQASGLGEHCK